MRFRELLILKRREWIPILLLLSGCATHSPEATAKRYCETLLAGDVEPFQKLFAKAHQGGIRKETFQALKPTTCVVESVSSPYVTVRYRLPLANDWPEETGVLYMLPDGRIKYDPIFVTHPALGLRGLLSQMEREDVRYRQSALQTLTDWNIPLFGFDPSSQLEARTNSLAQFRSWVETHESTFDLGEPKIPVSPIDQERLRKAARHH